MPSHRVSAPPRFDRWAEARVVRFHPGEDRRTVMLGFTESSVHNQTLMCRGCYTDGDEIAARCAVVATMSARKIVVDGTTFVRSRAGLVDGRLVDGMWFINLQSFDKFVAEQECQKAIWYAELARRRGAEQRPAGYPSALRAVLT